MHRTNRKIWTLIISATLIILVLTFFEGTIIGEASEKTESIVWSQVKELIVTATGDRAKGWEEFIEELRKVLPYVSGWGSRSLLDFMEDKRDLKSIRDTHTIFIIRPESIEELEKLEARYPKLLPLPYSKLISYSFPLLYFSCNDGKIRGIIIADKVTPLLAKLLTKKNLPLNVPFRHENGQLKEIKEE